MKLAIFFFLITSALISGIANAQGPGTIPLNYAMAPATDLMYQGKKISSSEAFELSQKGTDLSSLDPAEDQDIWKNITVENQQIQNKITPMSEVTFKDFVLSQTGKIRFLAKTSSGEILNFITSKNVHTQLLRRNLLVKLGYQVPEINYVPKLKINFSSSIDRELFAKALAEKTLGDPTRWIESSDEKSIVMDDLVSQKTNSEIVDLSIGYIPSQIIRNRRVLNSLHALYSLTDFSESANLFSWSTGFIFNDYLHLPYQFDTEFFATQDDIKWMAHRIAQLDRSDWEDIVSKSFLPTAVEKLIVEKLVARRNNLLMLVKSSEKDLSYNPKVSFEDSLSDGELIEEKFPGYAARFSFGDPESPMNIKELLNYGGVKVIGTLIDQLLAKFNSLPFLQTNLSYQVETRYNTAFLNQVFDYIKTGVYKPIPLGVYELPTYSGNLIASRDVIAGNYMGTDNLFQLVDTIGVSGFAGFYLGVEGINNITGNFPLMASGQAGVYYNRLYSHIKPIQKMKAALKYPLSNILVPLASIRVGHNLKKVLNVDDSDLTAAEQKELFDKVVPILNQKMLPGESFIITDTLGANLNVSGGTSFLKIVTAQIGVSGSQLIVSRLNILKISDTEYQIYRDVGNTRQFAARGNVSILMPLIKVKYDLEQGKSKMDFYQLKLDPSKLDPSKKNKDELTAEEESARAGEVAKYNALREAFLHGTIGKLKALQVPVKFRYTHLKQQQEQGSILMLQGAKINSRFNVRVLHPEGQQMDLFRRYTAKSFGLNIATPGTDAFSTIVKILTLNKFGGGITSYDGGGNAGFSLFGKAKSKTETFESAKDFLNDTQYAPIVKLSRIWNGWIIRQKKALDILKDIKDRYNFDFYPPDVLNDAKKIFLYAFSVNFTFYHDAIKSVLALSEEKIDEIAATDARGDLKLKNMKLNHLKRLIRKAQNHTDLIDISSDQNKIFDLIESIFTLHGIELMCGGKENFFVYSKIDGFRSKDENGDQPIFSSSYGEYGHYMVSGPFDYLKRLLGVTDGELGVNWLLRRIY